jgi:hypothetical protein
MNGNHEPLMAQLRELIVSSFEEAELADLLRVEVPREHFDFDGLSPTMPYKAKVMATVAWTYRWAGIKRVYWLAQLAAERRPEHPSFPPLITELKKCVESTDLPPSFVAALSSHERGISTHWSLAQTLRVMFRKGSYKRYDLPGRYHLSDSMGQRMAAVLALEAEPDPNYLRWLSERVTVEPPLTGTLASKALITSALRLERGYLIRLRGYVQEAIARLNNMNPTDESPAHAGVPFGVGLDARRIQLSNAEDLIEVRNGTRFLGMTLDDRDSFLNALVSAFDLPRFEELCTKQLKTELKRLAHPNDPIELIVVSVVVMARRQEWEEDLLEGVYAAQTGEPTFTILHEKYGNGSSSPRVK